MSGQGTAITPSDVEDGRRVHEDSSDGLNGWSGDDRELVHYIALID